MSDTTELQALVDAAVASGDKHIYLPPRTWVLDRGGRADGGPCVTFPPAAAGLTLVGAGQGATVLRMADDSPPSTRTLYAQAPGLTLAGLTLDGGVQADQDEHRAGLFATAPGLRLIDVEARGHTGDGVYLFTGADDALLSGCSATGNHRNGVTIGGALTGATLLACRLTSNGAQQFDTEPGAGQVVSRLRLVRCVLDALGASDDYVLTLGGSSLAGAGVDVLVDGCTLNGPVNVVWGAGVVLAGCRGVNSTAKPCVTMSRTGSLRVSGCDLTATRARYGILVQGTGEGSTPDAVIEDTCVTCLAPGATGLYASCVRTFAARRCVLVGAGAPSPGSAGINVRAVAFDAPAQRVAVEGCDVRSFGDAGVTLSGNTRVNADGTRTHAHLAEVWVSGNVVGNLPGQASQRRGFVLDDGTGIATRLLYGPGNVLEATVDVPTRLPDGATAL